MPDKANVGPVDAAIRWVLAAVFFAAALIWNDIPLVALLAALVALAMAGTALTRICPLYRVLGVSTCKRDEGSR